MEKCQKLMNFEKKDVPLCPITDKGEKVKRRKCEK